MADSKRTFNLGTALDAVPGEVWLYLVASHFEVAEILPLRAVSTAWRAMATHDDVWLNKLTVLSLQFPTLSQLDRAVGEAAFHWFSRCWCAICSGDALAERHRRREFPYLQLYGAVNGTTFTPFAPLCFPIQKGVIAELIELMARSTQYADPPHDASLRFDGLPPGVQIDSAFRVIFDAVKAERQASRPGKLRRLPEMLAEMYAPRGAALGDAGSSSSSEPLTSPPSRPSANGAPKLRLRLQRMSAELSRANECIAALQAENSRLRAENAKLRAENRELRAENARLAGRAAAAERSRGSLAAALQAARDEAEGELRRVTEQLGGQRRARATIARQLDAITAENERLRLLLAAAERAFEKAEAVLQRERGRVDEARDAAAAARLREAQAERDAAAQVAAAQLAATTAIEAEVTARIEERGLMSMSQLVDYAQLEAAVGMVSPPVRKIAAHVMAAECPSGDSSTTLPSTSPDGRGRGAMYVRVVRAIKPSYQLSPRQLWERTQNLRASLTQVRAQRFRIARLPCPPPPLPPLTVSSAAPHRR